MKIAVVTTIIVLTMQNVIKKNQTLLRLDLSMKLQCGGDCCGDVNVMFVIAVRIKHY